MKKTGRMVLMTGNEAMGEAAIRAGCTFYAGYPITPQNELTDHMARRMPEEKRVFIQAESELAAINMVFGAAATGARAMTSSSGPGMSLKQEGISYMAGAELPAVLVNVMRGGPGLGNIASSQSDYYQATRGGGHGDYFTPALAPWSVQEAMELMTLAFDMADYYRTPTLILADAIVGQMMEPARFPVGRAFKKALPAKTWALTGAAGRPANVVKSFFMKEGLLEVHNEHLRRKWDAIRRAEQRFETYEVAGARVLLVAFGSQARICREAVDMLRAEGVKAGLFRPVSVWPFPAAALRKAARGAKAVFSIEQSLGQMVDDVRLALPGAPVHFIGKAGGGIPTSSEIVRRMKGLRL